MKSIVFSANTSWYLYNFKLKTILAFKEKGFQVYCISPFDEYTKELIDKSNCKWLDVKIDNQGSNPVIDLFFCWSLFKLYKKIKPVIVFHFTIKNNIYGTWAAKLAKTNAVNNVSGLGTSFINSGMTSFIVRWLYKLSQPLAHKVFCQNEDDYKLLIEERLVPTAKLDMLPGSGVDVVRFNPNLLNNNTDIFVFLYVGRMLGDKGLNELINASKKLYTIRQDFTLQLCGFSGAKNSSAIPVSTLDEWKDLPFIDYIGPSNHIESIYAKADCIVLPSYREGMPRSLLEAGAMGLPSITTDVPGCHNIIIDCYNGLLCTVKDPVSLSNAMEKILNLELSDLEQLGVNARYKVVSEFNEDIVINKTLSILNSL